MTRPLRQQISDENAPAMAISDDKPTGMAISDCQAQAMAISDDRALRWQSAIIHDAIQSLIFRTVAEGMSDDQAAWNSRETSMLGIQDGWRMMRPFG